MWLSLRDPFKKSLGCLLTTCSVKTHITLETPHTFHTYIQSQEYRRNINSVWVWECVIQLHWTNRLSFTLSLKSPTWRFLYILNIYIQCQVLREQTYIWDYHILLQCTYDNQVFVHYSETRVFKNSLCVRGILFESDINRVYVHLATGFGLLTSWPVASGPLPSRSPASDFKSFVDFLFCVMRFTGQGKGY